MRPPNTPQQRYSLSPVSNKLTTPPLLEQSSESRLYTFSPETKEKLRKFRLGTSRAKDPQAVICIPHLIHKP